MRPSFLLSFLLMLLLTAFLPVQAQIHGVPSSVTSLGFGGNFNRAPGVPASVTSLGPMGYSRGHVRFGSCCFGSGNQNPPLFYRHGEHRHQGYFQGAYAVPVYVPYDLYGEEEPDYADSRPVTVVYGREGSDSGAASPRRAASEAAPEPVAAPAATPEPVASQPSTVLVFKDGHKTEVENYAIVGDILFDLAEGRTHKIPLADLDLPATQKANDDLGVDFKVPSHTSG